MKLVVPDRGGAFTRQPASDAAVIAFRRRRAVAS
jgi:hypothetical protein